MPEQKKPGQFQQQKTTKPLIEDVIHKHLDGDMRKTALNFVAYLRENGMPPKWFRLDGWTVKYKDQKRFCTIWIHKHDCCNPPSWSISFEYLLRHKEGIINEGLQNKFLDNVFYCVHSKGHSDKSSIPSRPCAGGRNVTVFGKDFKGVCQHRDVLRFYDPCEVTVKGMKKLIEIGKKAIDDADEVNKTKQENINEPKQMVDRLILEQKLTKPMMEDIIPVYLEGNMKENALDFVAWLRANGMSPGWYGQNRWKASTASKPICFLFLESSYLEYIPPLNLRIRLDLPYMKDYEDSVMNEELEKLIWDHISYCRNCAGCSPGIDLTLFGKEFKSICRTMILYFENPDKATLNNIKKLLEIEKKVRKSADQRRLT